MALFVELDAMSSFLEGLSDGLIKFGFLGPNKTRLIMGVELGIVLAKLMIYCA